ncbi:MAG: Ig domain-containing protein [Bacteroidaceae bacterium]|nr:Ig domain-containing protein [Bacteroidaceae bacterium]
MLFILMCAQQARADWDWNWVSGDWGHAVAWCEDCGTEYDIEGCDSSSDAESAAADLFCSGCGFCSRDVNDDCWLEHHCERCGDCLDDGDYNADVYDRLDLKVCDNCMPDFREAFIAEGWGCAVCGELFDMECTECDCEIDMLKPHCEDCGGDRCSECNTCLEVPGFELELGCEDHNLCTFNDCYKNAAGDGDHCALCGSCQNGDICGECYECENCWNHCSECDHCFTGGEIEWCKTGGGHCIHDCEDNSWLCSECGECAEGKGIDFCDDCGLCEECCDKKWNEVDCSHGFCIESSDFADHLCPGCGQCPQDTECDDCGMCADCQSDYHCEHELCPEGSDWDEHLCNTCGNCCDIDELCEYCGRCPDCQEHCDHDLCPEGDEFDDGDHFICEQCGDCYDSDRCDECELCADCCEANTESMGCDHQLCVNGSDFVEHYCYEDGQCLEFCEHEEDCEHARLDSEWSSDGNAHWKLCLDCGRAVSKATHSEGSLVTITEPDPVSKRNGTSQVNCAVCEAKMSTVSVPYTEIPDNGAPYIIVQPTDYTGKISDECVAGPRRDETLRYATFSVKAGGQGLKYQWYRVYGSKVEKLADERGYELYRDMSGKDEISGAQTNKLTVRVGATACYDRFEYYCEISNANGSVTTRRAWMNAQHAFGWYMDSDEAEYWGDVEDLDGNILHPTKYQHVLICYGDGCTIAKKMSKHRFGQWELVRPATDKQTGLRQQVCTDCLYKITEVIPKVEPGHVHVYNLYRTTAKQHWCHCACGVQKTDEAEDHTFGSPVVTVQPTEDRSGRQTQTCTVCSYEKAESLAPVPHVHDWYSFDDEGMFYYDKNLKKFVINTAMGSYSNKQHMVHCKRCDQVKVGKHCWADFRGTADATASKKGRMTRICGVCQFSEAVYNDYGKWPIVVGGGKAYTLSWFRKGTTVRTIETEVTEAAPGTTIYLKYDINWGEAFAEYYSYPTSELKFKRWCDLKGWVGENDIPWGNGDKVIPELTFSKPPMNMLKPIPSTVNACFVMPDGPAIVMADAEECSHPESAQVASPRIEATCAGYGNEAGTMCSLCGKTNPGERIEPLGHDLPSTPIAGTKVVEYCSTWTPSWPYHKDNDARFGYAGDFICNRCGKTVKGGKLPLVHGNRDKDNIYTTNPGTIWYVWSEWVNYRYPTCTQDGYSGDEQCKYCGKIVYRGDVEEFEAIGHEWGEWETVREATPKQKGLERRVCIHTSEWFKHHISTLAGDGVEEHYETRLVDYLPDYALKAAKTKLVFEWEYGKEPAAQTLTFASTGRNSVTAIEAIRHSVEGLATVSISGLTITVKPIASSVISKYGTNGSSTLTLTKVRTANGSVQREDIAMPVVLVMNVKKATPALSFASASKTVSIGTSAESPKVNNVTDDMTLRWRSADNSIATVNAETGVVTPIAEGSTTITATYGGNNIYTSASASYTLYTKKGETGLAFTGNEFTIMEGTEFTAPQLNNPNHLTVTYTSSNPAVATVDPTTGKVTPIGLGTTIITATFTGSKRIVAGSTAYKLVIGSLVGIDGIAAENSKEATYDLAGRRLNNVSRGVNIINPTEGKAVKVLRK